MWGMFSFLQRMELGHLLNKGDITKGEGSNPSLLYRLIRLLTMCVVSSCHLDLLDTKKNCRLLGAVLAKLESKFKSKQALAATVRKVFLYNIIYIPILILIIF